MTWLSSHGTGTPQSIEVRLIEKSCSPPRMKPERLVALALRLHELGVSVVPVEQRLLVAAELEEVVLLLELLDRRAVDRAVAVDEVVLGVVRLAGDAVQAFVGAELDVAVVVDRLQQLPARRGGGGARWCG